MDQVKSHNVGNQKEANGIKCGDPHLPMGLMSANMFRCDHSAFFGFGGGASASASAALIIEDLMREHGRFQLWKAGPKCMTASLCSLVS